eukprot:3336502-Prymnesium_polylepis.2
MAQGRTVNEAVRKFSSFLQTLLERQSEGVLSVASRTVRDCGRACVSKRCAFARCTWRFIAAVRPSSAPVTTPPRRARRAAAARARSARPDRARPPCWPRRRARAA